jgi:periplasmic protein TonB
MSARLQAGLALALALGLHVAMFSLRPEVAGAVSTGAGGEDLVSLQAADASLADLIAEWDRPPLPASEPLADLSPPLPDVPPMLALAPETAPEPANAPPSMAETMPLLPMAEALPTADISLPPAALPEPDLEPEPVSEPKPTQRPKARSAEVSKPAPARPKAAEQPKRPETPAARAPSAAQPAQRAAGNGGGAQAGAGGSAQAATLSKARQNDLKASWGATIRSRVERRKSYPSAARGASGTVTVRLTVSRSGQLAGVSVATSSGHPALDQAAIRAVQGARSFPAAPAGLNDASYTFTLPMKFAR